MKICMISASYPPVRCGVGDYTQHLVETLISQGQDVTVLTSGTQKELAGQGGGTVFRQVSSWSLTALPDLYRRIRAIDPDICHIQYPSRGYGRGLLPNGLLPFLRWRTPKIKCVITLHEYHQYQAKGRLRLYPAVRAAHRIVCTNSLDQERLIETAASFAEKSQIIPLGSNVGETTIEKTTKTELPKDEVTVLNFGTVMPNKGWEILLPALRRLLDEKFPVRLLVVGELDDRQYDYHRKVRQMISDHGLDGMVKFTGYLEGRALSKMLQTHPVAVQPYIDGAKLNRSSLIAMLMHQRAVVTVDPLIEMEMIKHGRHFWGVLPHDPTALANGIRHVLTHPELISKLRNNLRDIFEYFSWKSIALKHRALYDQLCSRPF